MINNIVETTFSFTVTLIIILVLTIFIYYFSPHLYEISNHIPNSPQSVTIKSQQEFNYNYIMSDKPVNIEIFNWFKSQQVLLKSNEYLHVLFKSSIKNLENHDITLFVSN